jgi:PKD repeat protein
MKNFEKDEPSRRRFIRDTSIAATGFFLLPKQFLGSGATNLPERTLASNPTQLENAKPGTTAWQLTNPALNREVEGYASLTSVNRGGQLKLFISVAEAQQVTIQFYRMGWYGGNGGRMMGQTTIAAINQPIVLTEGNDMVECNWTSHHTLNIPNTDPGNWVSGVYLAKLKALTSGKESYIIFVVRDDARNSDFLFQVSFSTYLSYNNWPYGRDCQPSMACYGSTSMYPHNSDQFGSGYKVSLNRPFAVGLAPGSEKGVGAGEFINNLQQGSSENGCGWEYNMVRWLEMKGYDITYATNIDTHEKQDLLLAGTVKKHKAFLSVGHDEYWSAEMRTRVEEARDNGIHLGFFSSNVCYWQVRFETSPLTGQANRTMVCYKNDSLEKDPYALDGNAGNDGLITTLWRNAPVNRPEASMVGVMYWSNPWNVDMVITNPGHWIYSGTNLALNERLPGLMGYEVDEVVSSSPPNIQVLAHSPVVDGRFADTTVYTAASGATVFGAGSNQLSWGLDDYNSTGSTVLRPSRTNPKFQQMISNLMARFLGTQFPVAKVGGPYSGTVGAAVSFNGSTSSDADGTIASYTWNFGDGTTGTGATPTHAYTTAGTFTVNLVVVDDMGAAHSQSTNVTITASSGGGTVNAPSGLIAALGSGNSGQIKLSWKDNSSNEQVFRIERSLSSTSAFAEIAQVPANTVSYNDKPPKKGTIYYYRVRASNGSIFSAYSNIASPGGGVAGITGADNIDDDDKDKNKDHVKSQMRNSDGEVDVISEGSKLEIRSLANPSYGAFNVQVTGNSSERITVRVTDIQGRLMEEKQNVQRNGTLRFGQNYSAGVYLIQAIQGSKMKQMKLLKSGN